MRTTERRARGERGVALVLVLWVFMVLGVLALDFARYIRDDAMAAINLADETRGYYLALAGMNQAILEGERVHEQGGVEPIATGLEGEEERRFPPDGEWHEGVFAGGRYAVRITDEGGRIPLNTVDEVLLTRVVTNLLQGGSAVRGLDRRGAEESAVVVDAILDWRDPDDLPRLHGAESEFYLALERPYPAKNGWFDSLEELLLVRGVTAGLFFGGGDVPGLRDVFSVHHRGARVNVRTAPPAVLQALLNVDAASAAELVAQRGADAAGFLTQVQAQLAAIDPLAARRLTDDEPTVVQIEARADLEDARNQSRVAAVIDLSAELTEGARILRWLDRAPWVGGLPGVPDPMEAAP
jgi:general secretion pathway protein K